MLAFDFHFCVAHFPLCRLMLFQLLENRWKINNALFRMRLSFNLLCTNLLAKYIATYSYIYTHLNDYTKYIFGKFFMNFSIMRTAVIGALFVNMTSSAKDCTQIH